VILFLSLAQALTLAFPELGSWLPAGPWIIPILFAPSLICATLIVLSLQVRFDRVPKRSSRQADLILKFVIIVHVTIFQIIAVGFIAAGLIYLRMVGFM